MKKENKAITLIALVITIVVLIILAAVAINLSLGNNGIFNRAKTAKEQYQNATQYEETEIGKTTNEIESYVSGNRADADIVATLENKMDSDKIIIEQQTKTTNQYGEWFPNIKTGYYILNAFTNAQYYMVSRGNNGFRVWAGNSGVLDDNHLTKNTSVTAFVVYLKSN